MAFCGTPTVRPLFSQFMIEIDIFSGKSAGTIYDANTTQNADDIEATFARALVAIKADPSSKTHITAISVDGASVQKAMAVNAIIPSDVCYYFILQSCSPC